MNNIRIRKYHISDKPELMEILQMNIPQYFAETEIKDFDHYLDSAIEQYFVIEINDKIVGSGGINFEKTSKTGKLSWDIINPNFQGKGLGTDLLKHRIALLHSMPDVEKITVRTSQFAFQFYEKNGFVLEKTQKDFWVKGFDMYKMIYK
ncbi:GNAT family N-acetyltransferase [Avrilella dinanensis]|uniref:GNAT family N-acetyltransferase n=1 Tax=Avrilella dinanensis TaxID=2008672 RepID=UPI00240A5139|nr:GNAT family N-acetyltransferase [Avrilella dinanensis]